MPLKYEAIASVGTYKAKDGTDKTKWLKVGAVFQTKNGLRLKLDALPVGFDGWLMLSEPRDAREDARPLKKQEADPDDALPF